MGLNRDDLNMEEQKMKENIDEKYRIKPRKKYARQVWVQDGRAVLVDPVEEHLQYTRSGKHHYTVSEENNEGDDESYLSRSNCGITSLSFFVKWILNLDVFGLQLSAP